MFAGLAAAIVLAALLRLLPRWPGLAHEVALPPLDLFADVRVLMARAPSNALFVVGVVAVLVGRAALLAAVLGFTRRRFGFALRFYAAALVPAVLAATLDFSGRAILYAYLIWGALFVVLATFVVLGAVPWVARDSLHSAIAGAFHDRLRLGLLAAYLVGLAFIGGVWRRPGDTLQVLVVPFSAALTVATARRLAAPPSRRSSFRSIAITGVAVVVAVALVAVVWPRVHDTTKRVGPPLRSFGSVVLIAGVDSSTGAGAMFKIDPHALGFTCSQTYYFSYRGPGGGGTQGEARCPIRTGAPYRKADTTRPLPELVAALRAQLVGLPPPVMVVTHSQGAWIAWSEITTDPDNHVTALVMLAPFSEGLAPYPRSGHWGAGAAGGVAVRKVTDIGRSLGINQFGPDAPLARELQGTSGAVRRLVSARLPGSLRALAVYARADLPLEPRAWPHELPQTCPGWNVHAAVPLSSKVTATVAEFLRGGSAPGCPGWVEWLGHTTDAFGAPSPVASR